MGACPEGALRVAAVQFKPVKGDVPFSCRAMASLVDDAGQDADLVVLPEMAATGYVFEHADDVRRVAEPPRGATFEMLSPIARGRGTWIVAGFPEDAGEHLYNSALIIDPEGDLQFVYRKTLLFDSDMHWASPGRTGYRRFRTLDGSFTVGICMDLNDPWFVAWCERQGSEVIAFPTNWVDEGADVWPYWQRRIARTGSTLVAANSYGIDGDITFSGRSAILDAWSVLASAPVTGDVVVRAEIPSRPRSRRQRRV